MKASRETPRKRRVPVLFTEDEYDRIETAAYDAGLGVSTFIRVKALEAIGGKDG